MSEGIIVLNAGSSSLKFSLYSVTDREPKLEAKGQIEGLGASPHFKAKDHHGRALGDAFLVGNKSPESIGHAEGFDHLARWIREKFGDRLRPIGVGHRVVHGGTDFAAPVLISPEVLEKLERIVPLVPLHQPHNLAAIKGVARLRPDIPQVACFDTSFHRGRSKVTEQFGLPDKYFHAGVRRWGFHGLSYQYIADQFRRVAPDTAAGRVIVAHLGSGASMCAMRNGRSVDTTMSFSVLDGLPMGTRCGSLDAGVVLFLLQKSTREEIETMLYKKSGLLGISGISNDVRELLASDNPRAANAVDYFVHRAIREIGSLTAALGGLDALIFTAGIGENSPLIRQRICEELAWLGIDIDAQANEHGKGPISHPGRTPSVWVIPTDEEAVIAAGTLAILRPVVARSSVA
jgi:acetate kinase